MKPQSRNTDPVTSHMAEASMVRSGAMAIQRWTVYNALKSMQGCTSAELARSHDIDRYTVARRLPDLADSGYVSRSSHRRCTVTGRQSITWKIGKPKKESE